MPSIPGHPGVMRIYDPNPITQTWHSDTTHAARPPALTFLLARTVPAVGGDTMWASAYAAFDGLSEGLRDMLGSLHAVHQGTELAAEDSAPLLEHLYAQFRRPEYQYRHHWVEGDLVIWDNRSTQHAVVGDTGGGERVLHRVTVAGEVPA